ncbi:hypothetical protein AB0G83_13095 [Streptomyces klenkii]|uniref:hypothetical protein n=1 Tax=Streptomyces klenkii TaxID=1420899 RepID=UPI0033D10A36
MQSPVISEHAHPLPEDGSRPKLRSDALWVPHDDGAFLLCNASSLTIRGKSSYELVSRIAPHLDGTTEVGRLLSGLPPAVAAQVRALLRRLAEAGFVRDAAVDRPHGLTGRELTDYAGELSFIEYFRGSPAARYEAFRDTRVLCVGSGMVFDGLLRALVQLGNRRTTAAVTGGAPAVAGVESALKPVLAAARERDAGMGVRTVPLSVPLPGPGEEDFPADRLMHLIGANDFVLHFADDFGPGLARAIDESCARAGVTVLHGAVQGDQVWLGPLCGPDDAVRGPGLWARTGVDGTGPRSVFLTESTARIVAAQPAFAAFKVITGVPAEDFRERVVRVDLATLITEEVSLHALDLLPAGAEAAAPPAAGWASAAPPPESESTVLSQAFSRLVDSRDGLIRDVDEGDLTQIPLHRCRAEVAPLAGSGRAVAAEGDGLDLLSARVTAVLAAAESAGLRAVLDPAGGEPAVPPAAEAFDLVTAAPVRLSSHDVRAWRDDGAPVDTASAADWDDAVACALGRVAARLLRTGPRDEGTECVPVGPDVPRLLSILAAAGHRPVLRTLYDAEGFAIVRADCGAGLTGVGSATSAPAAGTDALYDAVRALHERVFDEPLRSRALRQEAGGAPLHARTEGATAAARAARWLEASLPTATRLVAVPLEVHPVLRRVGRVHCAAVAVVPAADRAVTS